MNASSGNACNAEILALIPVNPEKIFVLWSFNDIKLENFRKGFYGKKIKIVLYSASDSSPVFTGEYPYSEGRRYIDAPRKEGEYFACLYILDGEGKENKALESNRIRVEPKKNSGLEATYGSRFFKKGES